MPVIQTLMQRLGFVKLADFGLILTPEGRVLSLRSVVLDDGFGGKVVGWKDGDLAAAELERWEPARPAGKPAVAGRVAANPVGHSPAAPVAIAREHVTPMAVARPIPSPPAVPSIGRAPAPVVAPPPAVAVAPVVEEDDWEWTIAIARARAAADDEQRQAAAPPAPRRTGANTVPPPVLTRRVDPIAEDAWPETEPLTSIDYNDYTNPSAELPQAVRIAEVPRVAAAQPLASRSVTPPGAPRTVIPVPQLPTLASSRGGSTLAPVAAPPRRIAKGTGSHHPNTVSSTRHTDATRPSLAPAPAPVAANDDTVPGLLLPAIPAVRPLPSIKRVMRG